LERSIKYSRERIQFGTTLAEKQGYTHRLLVPHAVQLEAARAYIEEVARRLDTEEEDLQVEGSIAKYFATEAGDSMANDAIQAFGGYGYIREYEVEKIKRDVKILTIYEGTSEIQRNIISMFRLRSTVRSKGGFYREMADKLNSLSVETGGPALAGAMTAMNTVILKTRANKLTKSQHVMFLLADMMTWAETAKALCHKAATHRKGQVRTPAFLKGAARLFVRETVEKIYFNSLKIGQGCSVVVPEIIEAAQALPLDTVMKDYLHDMDLISTELVG
jgi:alkylation response protein AidB-like acyl-CoA dehydrogenase